jgi:hypothetical protein
MKYSSHQDQVTWLLLKLDQTHAVENVEPSSCCIIIQCYNSGINNDKRRNFALYC